MTAMEIKADRAGFRIRAVGLADDAALVVELERLLAARHDFFAGAHFRVVTDRPLHAALLEQIAALFERYPDLTLAAVEAPAPAPVRPARPEAVAAPQVVRHTLRSGQQIVHPGDVIVVGDVNPGATVVAGGDVLVFGALRGQAFAGQPDHRDAAVYALRFQPSQIRIGDQVAQGAGSADGGLAERAYYDPQAARVVVVPWHDVRLPEAATAPVSPRQPAAGSS